MKQPIPGSPGQLNFPRATFCFQLDLLGNTLPTQFLLVNRCARERIFGPVCLHTPRQKHFLPQEKVWLQCRQTPITNVPDRASSACEGTDDVAPCERQGANVPLSSSSSPSRNESKSQRIQVPLHQRRRSTLPFFRRYPLPLQRNPRPPERYPALSRLLRRP